VIAAARDQGLSDEAMITLLREAADALQDGLS
jgi:hypothetical protein